MDFYFQDQLRSSYGFENPNKAAAFLASVLPFLWVGAVLAWKIPRKWLRSLAVASGTGCFLGGWWLLGNTLSRGGIFAALGALAYLGWREFWLHGGRPGKPKLLWFLATICGLGFLLISTHAIHRGLHGITTEDKSVSNRWPLWRGGLAMAVDNPQGVGSGKSGEFYRQWYQPLEMTARYRTLVNSYLTFLAERGFLLFGGAMFLSFAFWFTTQTIPTTDHSSLGVFSSPGDSIQAALRASIIAGCLAGFWSTTLEDGKLWLVPGLSALGLMGFASVQRCRRSGFRSLACALLAAAFLGGSIYVWGLWLARDEKLRVTLRTSGDLELLPKTSATPRTAVVFLDERVMGQNYGRLLRQLAQEADLHLSVSRNPHSASTTADLIIAAGQAVAGLSPAAHQKVILLAPARLELSAARRLVAQAKSVKLLVPDFDEDGRVEAWKHLTDEPEPKVTEVALAGVGLEVAWAWDQIIALIKIE